MTENNEIVLYRPDETLSLDVRVADESVWLSQQQMAELFGVKENTITYHIKEIYASNELQPFSTAQKIRVVRKEGNRMVNRAIDFYNLDMIISVGYRVNSHNATLFRQWATNVLRQYMMQGYAINQRLVQMQEHIDHRLTEHEQILAEHQRQIDFFVQTNIPPVEKVFFEGDFFEARVLIERLIKTASKRVVIIDGYVDAATFDILDVRAEHVIATIYTHSVGEKIATLQALHNEQQGAKPIEVKKWNIANWSITWSRSIPVCMTSH